MKKILKLTLWYITIGMLLMSSDSALATYEPFKEDTKAAFGELLIAELTPVVQLHSAYNINTRIIDERSNNGSASISNNKFQVSTGAVANQSSAVGIRSASAIG